MITISPGHWSTGGAVDLINEVVEARKVTNRVVELLRSNKITVNHVEDNTSKNQQQNLSYLVKQHNATKRELDVSVHFNAHTRTSRGQGVEVLYYDQQFLAAKVSKCISQVTGLIDRGAKPRKELAFLNGTNKPAILIEVCFVSSTVDVAIYNRDFEKICQAIAKCLAEYVGEGVIDVSDKIGYNIQDDAKAFRVQSGKYTSKEDAEKAAKKALESGAFQYVTISGTKE